MEYQHILYDVQNEIATLTINRPDALNSLNPEVISELKSAIDIAGADESVGVIILTGAGRAFCAGVDLKSLGSITSADVGAELNDAARGLQIAIETVPKVVICKLNGFCLTGGLEIALACDLIIAADEAKIGDPHTKWGLRCTWGMSQRLPHRIGELKARELTYTAEMIDGQKAEKIGMVNRSVPIDQLDDVVQELARKILSNSRDAIAAHKFLYGESKKDAFKAGLEREYSTMPAIGDTVERITGFAKK